MSRKFKTTAFYNSLEKVPGLTKSELALFKMLSGFWIKNGCPKSNLVSAGHTVLAKKSFCSKSQIQRIIKQLAEKGYLEYVPGDGVPGQQKNISRFSQYTLIFKPEHVMPGSPPPNSTDDEIKWARGILVAKAEADPHELGIVVAKGEAKKAIRLAKGSSSLRAYKEAGKKMTRLKALLGEAS